MNKNVLNNGERERMKQLIASLVKRWPNLKYGISLIKDK